MILKNHSVSTHEAILGTAGEAVKLKAGGRVEVDHMGGVCRADGGRRAAEPSGEPESHDLKNVLRRGAASVYSQSISSRDNQLQ